MPLSSLATSGERKVYDNYMKRWGKPYLPLAIHPYHSILVAAEAAEAVGSVDPGKIMEWIRTHEFWTIYGPARMGGEQTFGVKHQIQPTVYIIQVRDGKAVALAKQSLILP